MKNNDYYFDASSEFETKNVLGLGDTEFEVNGIQVKFENRVFNVFTKDNELLEMVVNYLEVEGFFDLCHKLYGYDWGFDQVN